MHNAAHLLRAVQQLHGAPQLGVEAAVPAGEVAVPLLVRAWGRGSGTGLGARWLLSLFWCSCLHFSRRTSATEYLQSMSLVLLPAGVPQPVLHGADVVDVVVVGGQAGARTSRDMFYKR